MENAVPRVRLEPTTLAFRKSVLPLHHVGSLLSPLYPHPPVCAAPCLRVSADHYITIILYIATYEGGVRACVRMRA